MVGEGKAKKRATGPRFQWGQQCTGAIAEDMAKEFRVSGKYNGDLSAPAEPVDQHLPTVVQVVVARHPSLSRDSGEVNN
jgi:hypothetical protein